jgi:hypothetical protein
LIGFQLWMFGLVADLMAANRRLMEENRLRLRRLDMGSQRLNTNQAEINSDGNNSDANQNN